VKKADSEDLPVVRRAAGQEAVEASDPGKARSVNDVMDQADPAYAIVSTVVRVVPASSWSFARVAPNGDLVAAISAHGDRSARAEQDELKRQRVQVKKGPRIAATLGPLGNYESGITLLFADARADFGILTLLRTPELVPFTSSEVSMLTFALDALSDRLSALRLQAPQRAADPSADDGMGASAELADHDYYVLDRDMQIVLAWNAQKQRQVVVTGLHTRIAERLPAILEQTVRDLTAAWSNDSVRESGVARPVPFLVVRTEPVSGPAGLFIGVRVDRFQPVNSLTGPAARYHISPREVQVLALLLDGNHLDQIAGLLNITSSTVQDHVKSMLDKTESRNRSELIARVLGWQSPPGASHD
jgi:DNA-binding CsgD family transcriptional regulator